MGGLATHHNMGGHVTLIALSRHSQSEGAISRGLLGYLFGSWISATDLFGLVKFIRIGSGCQASGRPSPSQVRRHPQTRISHQGQAVGPWHQTYQGQRIMAQCEENY